MADAVLTFTLKAKDEASRVVKNVMGGVMDDAKALNSTVGKLAQSFGFSDSKATALAKTLPLVGAGIAAVTGVATAAGVAIFALTKNASDAGSEIFEAGQKSNLSAEFLSVLKVQAEQSGSSFEGATSKVVKWGNSLVDAGRGNKDLIADLKRFGIDAAQAYRNPEAALKTFIENFNKLPPSAANNEAAMRLFKDRSGELIPVLRAFGSDYDGLVRKLDASGQIWTQEGVEKADEFGDALTELGQVASGLGNVFAREVMPAITDAMKEISKAAVENRDRVKEWGTTVGDTIRGVRELADSHLGVVVGWLAKVAYYTTPLAMLANQTAQLGAQARDAEALKNFGPFGGRGVATPLTPGSPAPSALASADVVNEVAAKAAEAARTKAQREAERESERQASVVKRLADEYRKLSSEIEHFNDSQVEQQIATMRLNSGVETLTGQRRKEAEMLLKINAQEMRTLDSKQKIKEALERAKKDEEELRDLRANASDKVRASLNEQIRLLVGEETQLERVNKIIKEAEVREAIDTRTAAWLRQLAAINDIADKIAATAPPIGADVTVPQAPGQERGPVVTEDVGVPPPPNLDPWNQAFGKLKSVAGDTFKGIASGFAQAVGAFAAGAAGAGKSFGAIARAAIQSFTAMALVQALMELAYGFAALTPWGAAIYGPAPAHFKAAALLGAAAAAGLGVGALVGGGGGASGGSASGAPASGAAFGGGSGGFGNNDDGPRLIEQSRNTLQQQVIILRVESNDSHVISVVQDDVRKNGSLRNLIVETAAA
jgi:hypothetical protein